VKDKAAISGAQRPRPTNVKDKAAIGAEKRNAKPKVSFTSSSFTDWEFAAIDVDGSFLRCCGVSRNATTL